MHNVTNAEDMLFGYGHGWVGVLDPYDVVVTPDMIRECFPTMDEMKESFEYMSHHDIIPAMVLCVQYTTKSYLRVGVGPDMCTITLTPSTSMKLSGDALLGILPPGCQVTIHDDFSALTPTCDYDSSSSESSSSSDSDSDDDASITERAEESECDSGYGSESGDEDDVVFLGVVAAPAPVLKEDDGEDDVVFLGVAHPADIDHTTLAFTFNRSDEETLLHLWTALNAITANIE